jgi:hypothetical protein
MARLSDERSRKAARPSLDERPCQEHPLAVWSGWFEPVVQWGLGCSAGAGIGARRGIQVQTLRVRLADAE